MIHILLQIPALTMLRNCAVSYVPLKDSINRIGIHGEWWAKFSGIWHFSRYQIDYSAKPRTLSLGCITGCMSIREPRCGITQPCFHLLPWCIPDPEVSTSGPNTPIGAIWLSQSPKWPSDDETIWRGEEEPKMASLPPPILRRLLHTLIAVLGWTDLFQHSFPNH